jgi:trigger factor
LKIETQPLEQHQVKIIAEFEPEVLEKYKQRAARKIAQTSKIPGFRPGKAPYAVIHRLYGEEAIEHEAVDLLLDEEYQAVIKEAGVSPAAPGKLEEIISTNPPKFAFTVPLMPEVRLGDYQSLRKEYQPPSITEDRVDQVVKNMRASYSTAEPAERPAQEGDLVSVIVKGELVSPAEGEEPLVIPENTVQMIVGENEFEVDDWPYIGFSRELIGMNAGEEKTIVHTFPADDPDEKLRNKEVKITAKVQTVKSLTLPEINDEFAQTMGEYDSVETMRKSIRQTLEDNEKREYDNKYLTDLVDQVRGLSIINYPPDVLQEEVDRVLHSLEDDLAERKMDLPTYLKTINQEEPAFIESDVKPVARQRLERSLVLDELAHAENIQLDLDELQKETDSTMAALANDPEFKKMARGRKGQDLARGVTMESANRVLNRQVLDRLKAIARGELEPKLAPETPVEPVVETTSVEPVVEASPAAPSEPKEKKARKKKSETKAE